MKSIFIWILISFFAFIVHIDRKCKETFIKSVIEINKNYIPSRINKYVIIFGGVGFPQTDYYPGTWEIVVEVDGSQIICPATEEQYNNFSYGEIVKASLGRTGIFGTSFYCKSIK